MGIFLYNLSHFCLADIVSVSISDFFYQKLDCLTSSHSTCKTKLDVAITKLLNNRMMLHDYLP